MFKVFIKRVLMAIPVLLAVATMTFFLIKLAPGGPFDAEKAVSPQVLKNLNEVYNLDASQWEQYTDYMSGIVRGDFGPSFKYPGRSVTEMIGIGLPITFELAIYAILIALVIDVFSGGRTRGPGVHVPTNERTYREMRKNEGANVCVSILSGKTHFCVHSYSYFVHLQQQQGNVWLICPLQRAVASP